MLLMFQNKTNIGIIGFELIHFRFALDSSDIDLWNIYLLDDTHLDLLHTDIPSKHFLCLQDVLKTSSRHVTSTSSRHVFKTFSRYLFKKSSRRLGRRRIVTLKTCWRRMLFIDKLKNVPTNLSNLKSKVDKLDVNKLVPFPVDLSK